MTSINIKFHSSVKDGSRGILFYHVVHNSIGRQIKTPYAIYINEWNSATSEISFICADSERGQYLAEVAVRIRHGLSKLHRIVSFLESHNEEYNTDDVISLFCASSQSGSFMTFMSDIIKSLKNTGKVRTSEAYMATFNSFNRFVGYKDVLFDEMDSDKMIEYEYYLKSRGVSQNSSSFYMRNLRAVYNRAVAKNMTLQRYPFRSVYTGVSKTLKRAVSLNVIKQIKEMDLSHSPSCDFARDMFLFAFYTRGMSFIDMAYLKKKNLTNGILSYYRRKTGQPLFIRWEKPMQDIVDKYYISDSIYMLPIIRHVDKDDRLQYIYAGHNINRSLKIIGRTLGLSLPLTMYVARHAWASIARSKNIPVSVICEGMGHNSERTTRIYLAALDNMAIDNANNLILNCL